MFPSRSDTDKWRAPRAIFTRRLRVRNATASASVSYVIETELWRELASTAQDASSGSCPFTPIRMRTTSSRKARTSKIAEPLFTCSPFGNGKAAEKTLSTSGDGAGRVGGVGSRARALIANTAKQRIPRVVIARTL